MSAAAAAAAPKPATCPCEGCTKILDGMCLAMPACEHCKRKYCDGHRLPEKHGCRDAVKVAARFEAGAAATAVREQRNEQNRNEIKARFEAKKAAISKRGGAGGGAAKKK
jgi:hypothetical protein